MERAAKKIRRILAFGQKDGDEGDRRAILEEIDAVKRELACVSILFDYETSPDLIDAYIYQMQALQARYTHLLKCARAERLEAGALPRPAAQ